MRVQCSICTDLFEDEGCISALYCGHTFHENCINQWLSSANTCPSCRTPVERGKIIKRLFFDKGDEEGVDESKLTNENNHLKAKLKEKDKEKDAVMGEKRSLDDKIRDLKKDKRGLELKLKEDQIAISSLKKQLLFHQSQQQAVELEREECKKAKRKMIELKNIETLLSGCERDVQELLERHVHGEGSIKELAKYCAILKSEYEQVKCNRKGIKTDLDRCKRELIMKDTELKDALKELKHVKEMSSKSEQDLQNAEKQIDHLKKKVILQKNALENQSGNGNDSFIHTLTDSPKISTPVLSAYPQNIINDTPSKLELAKPSPNTQLRQHCQENNVKVMKITSAAGQPAAKRQKCDDIKTVGNFNIFKRKAGVDMSSAIRKGYDGLGGHMTFTQRQSKPKLTAKKSISRTNGIKTGKAAGIPKLPSLDNFVVLE